MEKKDNAETVREHFFQACRGGHPQSVAFPRSGPAEPAAVQTPGGELFIVGVQLPAVKVYLSGKLQGEDRSFLT